MVHPRCRSSILSRTFAASLLGFALAACGQGEPDDVAPGAVHGTLRIRIANYEAHSETFYRLVTKDETIALSFGEAPAVTPGSEVVVRGIREPGAIRVTDLEVRKEGERKETLALASAQKALKVALIIVDSSYTVTRGKERLLMAADSPAAFYKENSYGDWTIDGDAFGPFTIDIPNCNDTELDPIAERASAAAQAAGVDVSQYDNLMFYMPASAGCTWGGIAEVGINPVTGFKNGKNTWYRGDGCVVFAQELGHNFGLLHSHTCTAAPYASADYGGAACAGFREYGDTYTPMGGGCGHFNAPEMGHMGFISGCNTVDVAANGTLEIGPIETRCAGPQVLRVAGAANVNQGPQYIYAEYRKGQGTVGSDTHSPQGVYLHASAPYGGNLTTTQDPDNRYAVDPFSLHAPLTAGEEWTEPTSGVTFRVMAASDTATVALTFAAGGGAGPKCLDGSTPPASPMCGAARDAGIVGTGGADGGGAGGARQDGGSSDGSGGGAGASGGSGGNAGRGGAGGAGAGGASGAVTGGSGGSSGGLAGTAGASTGRAGSNGSTTTAGAASSRGEDSGCGCRTVGSRSETPTLVWLGLAVLVSARRRTRASISSERSTALGRTSRKLSQVAARRVTDSS
jgi:hypothetical protein